MINNRNIKIFLASLLLVPFLTLFSPHWLKIFGIGPCWAIFWLLPWSLHMGPKISFITSICLGLMLDGITIGSYSQVPSLVIISVIWGYLGKRNTDIYGGFNLGFLAWLGSIIYGGSVLIQFIIFHPDISSIYFNNWLINNLLSQSIITGFLAPIVCPGLLNFLSKKSSIR